MARPPCKDLLILALMGIIARVSSASCPGGMFQLGGQCYRLYNDVRRNWFDAKAVCAGNNMILAELPQDPVALAAYLERTYGLTYWTWTGVKGDRIPTYSPYWRPDRPGDRRTDNHCMVLMGSRDGLQNFPGTPYESIYCDSNKQWTLCQSKCPEGMFQVGGQCYRLFKDVRRNWFEAKAVCEQNGLSLAEPEDPVAVTSLLVKEHGITYSTWTGVKGERIPIQSPYWRPGRPANRVTRNHCLVLMTSPKLLESYPGTPYDSYFCDSNKQYTLCQ